MKKVYAILIFAIPVLYLNYGVIHYIELLGFLIAAILILGPVYIATKDSRGIFSLLVIGILGLDLFWGARAFIADRYFDARVHRASIEDAHRYSLRPWMRLSDLPREESTAA